MNPVNRKFLSAAVICLCFGSSWPQANARKVSFQLPGQDKITEGAGPASPKKWEQKPISAGQSLAPVGLGSDDATAGSEGSGYLKSSVSTSQFVGAGSSNGAAASADGKSKSLVGNGLGDKLLKDSKKVDVGPLALRESDEESAAKADTVMDAEKRQLGDLWSSTISRNPDIQFVITKLQPTGDSNHAMANTMKFLSTALFGAMNVAPMMMGGPNANPAAIMGMSGGASVIQNLFADQQHKNAKKQMISQEQATILYKIVRDTAEKLVTVYRSYKKDVSSTERATGDFQELQTMVAEARTGQDAAKQIEMEWTLRKAQREIEEKLEDVKGRRQELIDLAGSDAVAKLDKEMEDERLALQKLTGSTVAGAETGSSPLRVPSIVPAGTKQATGPGGEQKSGKQM